MTHEPSTPTQLLATPSEAEAAVLVAALRERGIDAIVFGGALAGMRAETVVSTQVMVRLADLERASAIMREIKNEQDERKRLTAGEPAPVSLRLVGAPEVDGPLRKRGLVRRVVQMGGRGYVMGYIACYALGASALAIFGIVDENSRAYWIPVLICGVSIIVAAYFIQRWRK